MKNNKYFSFTYYLILLYDALKFIKTNKISDNKMLIRIFN